MPVWPVRGGARKRLAPVAGEHVAVEPLEIRAHVRLRRALRPPQAGEVRPIERFEQGDRVLGRRRRPRPGGRALRVAFLDQRLHASHEIARLRAVVRPARMQAVAGLLDAALRAPAGPLAADVEQADPVAHAAEGVHGLGPCAFDRLLGFALGRGALVVRAECFVNVGSFLSRISQIGSPSVYVRGPNSLNDDLRTASRGRLPGLTSFKARSHPRDSAGSADRVLFWAHVVCQGSRRSRLLSPAGSTSRNLPWSKVTDQVQNTAEQITRDYHLG